MFKYHASSLTGVVVSFMELFSRLLAHKVCIHSFHFLCSQPNREEEREKKFSRRLNHSPQSSSRYRDGRYVWASVLQLHV